MTALLLAYLILPPPPIPWPIMWPDTIIVRTC